MCTNVYSFEYLLDFFITDRMPAKATIKQYKLVISLFQRDTKIIDIREINKHIANQWRNQVLDRASASTCNNYLRHLKSLFNCALEEELIKNNPFAKVKIITTHRKLNRTTNSNDVAKALSFLREEEQDYMPGWFWIAVIKMLYYTGMRRKQLTKLCWKDIDFERRIIQLRAESSKNNREWEIPLNHHILQELIFLKTTIWELVGLEENINNLQVFNVTLFNPRYRGDNMTEEQVSGFFRHLSEKLEFKLSPHRFRHHLASELVNKKGGCQISQRVIRTH